jgi:hypothetical protein
MPNCVASVWRVPEIGTDLGYGNWKQGGQPVEDRPPHLQWRVAVHFPGLAGLNKPIVWVFPEASFLLGL